MNIFVTVGTHSQGFDRLIKEVDELLIKEKIKDKVFAQIGNTKYIPKKIIFKKFLNEKEYLKNFKKADLIISHAGAGSIINALKLNKKLILVPRLKKFNEHTDNHQIELAKEIRKKYMHPYIINIGYLSNCVKKLQKKTIRKNIKRNFIGKEIEKFLNQLKNK